MKIYGNAGNMFTVKEFIERQQNMLQDGMNKRKKFEQEVPEYIKRMRELQEQREQNAKKLKNDQVAKKIARGQPVTAAERKRLYNDEPEKYKKAVLAEKMGKAMSKRLSQAKTKAEKLAALAEGKSLAVSIAEKGDQELGELYLEAINKAEMDDLKKRKSSRTTSSPPDLELIDKSSRKKIDIKG